MSDKCEFVNVPQDIRPARDNPGDQKMARRPLEIALAKILTNPELAQLGQLTQLATTASSPFMCLTDLIEAWAEARGLDRDTTNAVRKLQLSKLAMERERTATELTYLGEFVEGKPDAVEYLRGLTVAELAEPDVFWRNKEEALDFLRKHCPHEIPEQLALRRLFAHVRLERERGSRKREHDG